ncbi:MAG: TonB-dependent receptor [Proteobacteria bacterium]|nr:TonB-dependent receptor [Pseudomonadota bacterium]MBU1058425.1 TonB-dependent receptor [Pseudomonadota bacterium]
MKQAEKSKVLLVGLALGFLSSGAVLAADEVANEPTAENEVSESSDKPVQFDIAIGTELMTGDTTYSIGGAITFADGSSENMYFPLSELEWPLDISLARVDAGLRIGSAWRINGILKKNISDPSDQMIDKDWLTSSNPGQLDVYSESNISDFDALIWDIDVEWAFLQRQSWSLYAGLGYQYQKFEYDAQLIHQYSPSGYPGFETYGDGSVGITYEMTYKMPYFLIGTDLQITPDFTLSGSFAYSPWVDAEDEDHHLARVPVKVSQGDMDGDAYMIAVSGTYNFVSSWFLEGGLHYTRIDVDGKQTQSAYGVPYATIDVESESTQTSGYLKVGYRF